MVYLRFNLFITDEVGYLSFISRSKKLLGRKELIPQVDYYYFVVKYTNFLPSIIIVIENVVPNRLTELPMT